MHFMKTVVITILSIIFGLTIQAQNVMFDTSFVANGKKITIETINIDNEMSILTIDCNSKKTQLDTLYISGLSNIELLNFDSDNYPDIVVSYLGNISIKFLYLFDSESNSFKKIVGFDNFPESKRLFSNYYYSYQRAGCADMNWISDLYKIEFFKIIHLGQIYGQGCESDIEEDPQSIEIYKVLDNGSENMEIFERLSYSETMYNYVDKWEFIEKYWNENYRKFE